MFSGYHLDQIEFDIFHMQNYGFRNILRAAIEFDMFLNCLGCVSFGILIGTVRRDGFHSGEHLDFCVFSIRDVFHLVF